MVDKWRGPPEDCIISPQMGRKQSGKALKWASKNTPHIGFHLQCWLLFFLFFFYFIFFTLMKGPSTHNFLKAKMQNWPSKFYCFSFQSFNFQFCQFNPLTFNFCQCRISLNPNYGLRLMSFKRRRFPFLFFFFFFFLRFFLFSFNFEFVNK